jgi:uncharacterized protein YigA (DUF484 family)
MTDDLYRENQILRRKLHTFLSQARENEQKMRRFQEQELRLISTASLTELVQRVLFNYRTAFGLDVVSLVLHDPEYEIQRILEEEGVRLEEMEQLCFQHELDNLDNLFGISAEPQLGHYHVRDHQFLFAKDTITPRSVALLPLVRYGNLIGSLNLGSENGSRFVEGAATDFLQRLATIVAICLENATNLERLKRVITLKRSMINMVINWGIRCCEKLPDSFENNCAPVMYSVVTVVKNLQLYWSMRTMNLRWKLLNAFAQSSKNSLLQLQKTRLCPSPSQLVSQHCRRNVLK